MEQRNSSSSWIKFKQSKHLIVFIVYITLTLDTTLLSSVVPMLPEILLHQSGQAKNRSSSGSSEINANLTNQTTSCADAYKKELLASENIFLAALLASKQLVQAIANFVIGPISDRIGYNAILPIGYVIMIASSLMFAFGQTYAVLFSARALQGIASSCASTAGLSIIAERFPDDEERGRKIGTVLGGLAMGALIGPTYASVIDQFAGRSMPFVILAVVAFIVGLLHLCTQISQSKARKKTTGNKSFMLKLLRDPYVTLCSIALIVGIMGVGALEAVLPSWMLANLCPEKWMLGVALLPIGLMYLLATVLVPRFTPGNKRWLACLFGIFVGGIGYGALPFCKTFFSLIGPTLLIGAGAGVVESMMFSTLGHLADIRHASFYGSAFALGDAAFSAAFFIGPLLAGAISRQVGFMWVMVVVALIHVVFAPFLACLRNPPPIEGTERKKEEVVCSESVRDNGEEEAKNDAEVALNSSLLASSEIS